MKPLKIIVLLILAVSLSCMLMAETTAQRDERLRKEARYLTQQNPIGMVYSAVSRSVTI